MDRDGCGEGEEDCARDDARDASGPEASLAASQESRVTAGSVRPGSTDARREAGEDEAVGSPAGTRGVGAARDPRGPDPRHGLRSVGTRPETPSGEAGARAGEAWETTEGGREARRWEDRGETPKRRA